VADAGIGGHPNGDVELNGSDGPDAIGSELDEQQSELERSIVEFPNAGADEEQALEPEDGALEEDPFAENLDEAPSSLEHATPDAEIADAQLAIGAQEAAEFDDGSYEDDDQEYEDDDDQPSAAVAAPARRARVTAEHEETGVSEHRVGTISRLVNFLRGSWRELQRVQWPDRRQVMQATGVVIGFVVVAGVFLGVSDWVAGKVMNLILYGSFN
jgi:preprotein translocase SecE subunit